jgi:tRNA nucleotidyltransferase (CCA-adding enzyme)
MPHTKEQTIITTHVNADFDALASMLAAQKLYPGAVVVFPGSQDKNLRNFFIKSMAYLFNMADIKNLDLAQVKKLILVDTRQASRIGKLAALLEDKTIEIHIYDHHPDMPGDIRGTLEVIEPTGSTVTLLTDIIKERDIDLTPDEATVMGLGIYEDTGSFSFSSTTEKDFIAAAFLLSKGANLNVISSLIAREISPRQVSLLNEMLQEAVNYNVNGIEVVITRVISDNYVPDFAVLVHKMIRMEDIKAIFAVAMMENKIYIVGRSRIPEVDVGAILGPFGGGGHNYAASASVKEKTMPQVEHMLIETLFKMVQSQRRAKDLMSSPAIGISEDMSCKQAQEMLTRYNVNALLVTQDEQNGEGLAGYVSRQVIEKALYHKLDKIPVKEYMTTDYVTVSPTAGLEEIQDKIIENKQRILPVVDGQHIAGVITRTDLLNILVRQSRPVFEGPPNLFTDHFSARTRKIINFINERLPNRIIELLEEIGRVADGLQYGAYVVGGFVRDLFLYRRNEDVDVVIEGDGIEFAKQFALKVGARIHTHRKFGTAVIIFSDGYKIDVASARMEYYKFPAALPIVEMSSIKLDLFRRDFTVNTLAIQLNPGQFGTLIDFFSAQKDIKEKAIRVLHNLSFVEDPTRVFRAIRFEQRFGFAIGKLTSGLIDNAVKMDFFKRLSGRRVFAEFKLILEEENPTDSVKRLDEYGLLEVIHPELCLSQERFELLNGVSEVATWHDLLFLGESYMKWSVYFMALIGNLGPDTVKEICNRLELPNRLSAFFTKEMPDALKCLYWLEYHLPVDNATIYRKLSGQKTELILFMMAVTRQKKVKQSISNYFTRLRPVRTLLRGRDLVTMGMTPGPIYRRILDALLAAKLNGEVKTRQDEIDFVNAYVDG